MMQSVLQLNLKKRKKKGTSVKNAGQNCSVLGKYRPLNIIFKTESPSSSSSSSHPHPFTSTSSRHHIWSRRRGRVPVWEPGGRVTHCCAAAAELLLLLLCCGFCCLTTAVILRLITFLCLFTHRQTPLLLLTEVELRIDTRTASYITPQPHCIVGRDGICFTK